jgi:hypothetical protein
VRPALATVVAVSALQLGRQMIEGWNVDRLETVFATWDEDIVIRTDPSWPERIWFGARARQASGTACVMRWDQTRSRSRRSTIWAIVRCGG